MVRRGASLRMTLFCRIWYQSLFRGDFINLSGDWNQNESGGVPAGTPPLRIWSIPDPQFREAVVVEEESAGSTRTSVWTRGTTS
jgi:CRP-like cAMP-binding protein